MARKVVDETDQAASDMRLESQQLRRSVRSNLEVANRTQSMHQTALTQSSEIHAQLAQLNDRANQPTMLVDTAMEVQNNLTRLIQLFASVGDDLDNNLKVLEFVNALYSRASDELAKDPDDPSLDNADDLVKLKDMWAEVNDTVNSAEFLDVISRVESVERDKSTTVQMLDESIRQLEQEYEVLTSAILEAESQADYQRCLEIRNIQDTNEIMAKRRFLR